MSDLLNLKTSLVDIFGEVSLDEKDPNAFTLIVEGQSLVVESGRVLRTMDTVADAWTAVIRWDPKNTKISELLKAFGYQLCECYLGSKLVGNGQIYKIKNRRNSSGTFKEIHGFSTTVELLDNTVKPPFSQTKVSLEQRINTVTERFPFKLKYDIDDTELFDEVAAENNEKIYTHLSKLTRQRGALLSSTNKGELHVLTANTSGAPVDTISDDFPPGVELEIEFDGRARYYEYRAMAQTPGRRRRSKAKLKIASAYDAIIPDYRFMAFRADESSMGNIQRAADWERSRTVADALTIPYPVAGWYTSSGEMWRENSIVTVKSDVLSVPDGYNFLIRRVEFRYSSEGVFAILNLVPPQVYTGETVDEPWGVERAGWLESLI